MDSELMLNSINRRKDVNHVKSGEKRTIDDTEHDSTDYSRKKAFMPKTKYSTYRISGIVKEKIGKSIENNVKNSADEKLEPTGKNSFIFNNHFNKHFVSSVFTAPSSALTQSDHNDYIDIDLIDPPLVIDLGPLHDTSNQSHSVQTYLGQKLHSSGANKVNKEPPSDFFSTQTTIPTVSNGQQSQRTTVPTVSDGQQSQQTTVPTVSNDLQSQQTTVSNVSNSQESQQDDFFLSGAKGPLKQTSSEDSVKDLVKWKLRTNIQKKNENKPLPVVDFSPKPKHELTEDEKARIERRKQSYREASKRNRKKNASIQDCLTQTISNLEEEQEGITEEITKLQKKKGDLLHLLTHHYCKHTCKQAQNKKG